MLSVEELGDMCSHVAITRIPEKTADLAVEAASYTVPGVHNVSRSLVSE